MEEKELKNEKEREEEELAFEFYIPDEDDLTEENLQKGFLYMRGRMQRMCRRSGLWEE